MSSTSWVGITISRIIEDDPASRRFAFASLMQNGHVRPCELNRAPLLISNRSLMNWAAQLREEGASSFYRSPTPTKIWSTFSVMLW